MSNIYIFLKIFIFIYLKLFIFQGMVKMSVRNFYFNYKKKFIYILSYPFAFTDCTLDVHLDAKRD